MNEQSHPYDPYRNEPGQPGAENQPGHVDGAAADGAPAQPADDRTADPAAAHPHDPYAYQAGQQQSADPYAAPAAGGPAAGAGAYSAPQGTGPAGQQSGPAGQQSGYAGQQGAGYDGHQGPSYGAPGAHSGPQSLDAAPTGIKGVYEGPLSGQPMNDSDAKTWAMVSHLAALLQFVIPFLGGLIAQVVLYVIFKDRNRFVRYNAAEALNGTISAVIASLVIGAIATVLTIVTLGIGAFLYGLLVVPTVVQAVFAIIGAVKAYQGTWWNYPVNLRLVK